MPELSASFVERHSPFKPQTAIAAVLDGSYPIELRALFLAQLLVWTVLDQTAGRRSSSQNIKSLNASRAVLLYSALLLWRNWKSRVDNSQFLAILFKKEGGVQRLLGATFRNFLKRFEERTTELEYVYSIVDYLCRCECAQG